MDQASTTCNLNSSTVGRNGVILTWCQTSPSKRNVAYFPPEAALWLHQLKVSDKVHVMLDVFI